MKNMQFTFIKMVPILFVSLACQSSYAHEGDDPVLMHLMLEQLEYRVGDTDNSAVLEGQAWVGKDLNKLWLKTDIDREDGTTQNTDLQLLYSHAISPFWDLQIGARHDIKPSLTRNWGVIGIQGLAPYFFDVDAALFVGESGHSAMRFAAEYEMLLTQRLILSPSFKVNLYAQNDAATGTGSGLSDAEAGLRLRYEIKREFAPYVGINWSKKFGATATFAKNNDEAVRNTEWVVGLRAWF